MSDRKENRGGGARPRRLARRGSTSPAELAAHPRPRPVRGGGGRRRVDESPLCGGGDWPGLARELLRDGAPVSAPLRTTGGPLGRELRGTLRGCGRKSLGDLGRVDPDPAARRRHRSAGRDRNPPTRAIGRSALAQYP